MRTDELDYPLPEARIATEPAEPRDSARLLVAQRREERLTHHRVRDLPGVPGGPGPGDLLVLNATRVLPARFTGTRAATGGRVSGLWLGEREGVWEVMLESRGRLAIGERIALEGAGALRLHRSLGEGRWEGVPEGCPPALTWLAEAGRTPLPPYIEKARRRAGLPPVTGADPARYNTVFARAPGSVAAPTAALHFTPELLARLEAGGVGLATLTLHVGIGTFMPVRAATLAAHAMHREWIEVPPETVSAIARTRAAGGRVIPVGTTSVRALESLPDPVPPAGYRGETELFIRPPEPGEADFPWRFTDGLLTNFHLPRSTLIAMVAAMPGVGLARLKAWYAEAVRREYRFYSYGDAMLIV